MTTIDGNLVRGRYKDPVKYHQPSQYEKFQGYARNVGYAVGMANTLKEMYPVIRPVVQGLGMIA